MIQVYNSLTNKKQEFIPINEKVVNLYTCGVTVYDDCHIGHGRSIYIFEVIKRFLVYEGFRVNFVRNITDVDDKILNKAKQWQKEKGISLYQAFEKVRNTYIANYYEDLSNLGIPAAGKEPKATDNIEDMQVYIQKLIDAGFAYDAEGNVYFSVRKFPDYGKLSGKKIDDLISGERVELDPLKKDPIDFALWKKAKPGEISWESPWGKGRPGWHIECSVMSQKYLNTDILDIHGGGLDLIFPHHENELAQSEALSGKPFAKYWIHHGLITINKQKMSKSLNNFMTLKQAVNEYSPDIIKIFYLSAHYRSPLDFNQDKLKESKKIEERIKDFLNRLSIYELPESRGITYPELASIENRFLASLSDDFNMPLGFSTIFDLIGVVNEQWQRKQKDISFFSQAKQLLHTILNIFLITIKEVKSDDENIEKKVKLREQLRNEKRFEEADTIRQELLDQGILLEDLPGGNTRWIYTK